MNFVGVFAGLVALGIIGLGFPLVIYIERVFGYLWWPYVLGAGVLLAGSSTLLRNDCVCVIVGLAGAMLVWSSTELKEQAVRAELGWFPFNGRKLSPPFAGVIREWKAPHL